MILRRSKTYYRYLLPYVALLLAAVLALLVFSQAYSVTALKDSLLEAQRSRLRQTAQQLDTDIQQIYTIDYQISSVNENFLFYYISTACFEATQAIRRFKQITGVTPGEFRRVHQ